MEFAEASGLRACRPEPARGDGKRMQSSLLQKLFSLLSVMADCPKNSLRLHLPLILTFSLSHSLFLCVWGRKALPSAAILPNGVGLPVYQRGPVLAPLAPDYAAGPVLPRAGFKTVAWFPKKTVGVGLVLVFGVHASTVGSLG